MSAVFNYMSTYIHCSILCMTRLLILRNWLTSYSNLLFKSFGNSLDYLLTLQIYLAVQRGFDPQWLSITFSKAIFLGNGLVAIIAGLFANLLADNLGFGPVAPFDAAACFLAIGMAIILSSWSENYGDTSDNKDLIAQFKVAAKAIASGRFIMSTIAKGIMFF